MGWPEQEAHEYRRRWPTVQRAGLGFAQALSVVTGWGGVTSACAHICGVSVRRARDLTQLPLTATGAHRSVRLMAAMDFMLLGDPASLLLVVVPLVVIGLARLARRNGGVITHSELRKRMKHLQ